MRADQFRGALAQLQKEQEEERQKAEEEKLQAQVEPQAISEGQYNNLSLTSLSYSYLWSCPTIFRYFWSSRNIRSSGYFWRILLGHPSSWESQQRSSRSCCRSTCCLSTEHWNAKLKLWAKILGRWGWCRRYSVDSPLNSWTLSNNELLKCFWQWF